MAWRTANDDLARAFATLTAKNGQRFRPFRWQSRLLDRFIRNDLPAAVDIPTGLGKTSVITLWLIALGERVNLPQRLVYVVDRRAVVDQATREAERLRDNITPAFASKLGLGGQNLPISTLRGGFADNREWLSDPSKPAIVVGTVDMIGSRLLFEGYGVSRRMRPYQAGFLGAGTLLVLDEAHLCLPFESLVREIETHRDCKFGPRGQRVRGDFVPPPFRLMSLSATGRAPPSDPSTIFKLQDEDQEDSIVRERLFARKQLKITKIDDPRALPGALAQRAIELGYGDSPVRVLVYCNSRKDALRAKKNIDKQIKAKARAAKSAAQGVSELLVGARRVRERSGLECWLEEHGFLGSATSELSAPKFLVATSAGEVGIDLDADHMICDLVAYERMVQRLGRVNRKGGPRRNAIIDVFTVPPQLKKNASTTARQQHRNKLETFNFREAAITSLRPHTGGGYDASPSATVQLREDNPDLTERATTSPPLYPALTRPHVEAWAMTSLKKHEGRPDVAPWLRGWEEQEEPQTNVVWRAHLPCRRIGNDITVPEILVTQFFRCAPIHSTEKLETLRSDALDWLLKCVRRVKDRSSDHPLSVKSNEKVAYVLDRTGDFVKAASLRELLRFAKPQSRLSKSDKRQREDWNRSLANATLVVSSRLSGLTNDGMLDPKEDRDAIAADRYGEWNNREEVGNTPKAIKFRVQVVEPSANGEGLQHPECVGWRHLRTFETEFTLGGKIRRGLAVYAWSDDPINEESRSIRSSPQALSDHAEQVAAHARRIAERLGLPEAEIDVLVRAAKFHDDGKAAHHWQDAMNAPNDGRPYAKTRGGGNLRLLEGYRHEFGSLLRAEKTLIPEETKDLILHLIASHHGYARPLISSSGCRDGPPSVLESKVGEVALRYASLQKRYGIWGLAWRESLLRSADQSASKQQPTRSLGNASDA